ncbi:ATP-dependent RNA helicase RhlE [uncultured Desulfatiglans sp.]|uniref:DEAD-box ATP-dependent RNA helicase RhpA n=1 Tax=Uncultured Desulfatiglans sp. TaxID=1748965 RepID=A0A653A4L1_UNCDX|nr:ATP-dependent RNA helicase RhlE [uncultured Desulfatiglans sp.]
MGFETFGLNRNLMAAVAAAGYTTPTPIQKQAIPLVMQGRDVLGLAQTGTGKTAAFALPVLHRLLQVKPGPVRALVVAPTRELAEQIHGEFQTLARGTRIRSTAVYGGVGFNPQALAFKRGVEVVIACPGRLLDHLRQGTLDLAHVEVLVLDEADYLFDMGFLPDVRRIVGYLPSRRQNLLFSATMPAEIKRLAGEVLRDPATCRIGADAPAHTVSHALYPVAQHLKTALLMELLIQVGSGPVLVFTRTKHRAKRLGEQLAKAGHRSASLQGNLSQGRRQAALDGFRSGRFQVLVATDIVARGIDISKVSHVINYDVPSTPEAYIHRIGRTGRAGCSGAALTLVTREDKSVVCSIDRVIGSPIERRTLKDFDYDRPASASADVRPRTGRGSFPRRGELDARAGRRGKAAGDRPKASAGRR